MLVKRYSFTLSNFKDSVDFLLTRGKTGTVKVHSEKLLVVCIGVKTSMDSFPQHFIPL